MNKDNIWNIFVKKLTEGDLKLEDESIIEEWYNESSINKTTYKILDKIWGYNPIQLIDSSTIYSKFLQRRFQYEKKQSHISHFLYYSLRISAVLFLFIVTIILAKEYLITNDVKECAYQEIYVPKGNRTSLILPDGSKVWLANNSTLKYPYVFEGEKREVELSGEAYFEVVKNNGRSFVVNIGQNRIKVLGTKFSVKAYPEDDIIQADLISGKIQLDIYNKGKENSFSSYELTPLNSLVWNKTSGKICNSRIPEGFYNYWQKGIYEFHDETLENLSKTIDRVYNIEIVFEDELLKSRKFSGTISLNDNIFTFIEAIKRTSIVPIEYKYDKNKIYVKLKN